MEGVGFFLSKFFYCNTWKPLEFAGIVFDCDFMFFNTYNLFFEFFMCKVLGLGFFYYKIITYFFIFFGLGSKLESN
jgi:hypothetical protein